MNAEFDKDTRDEIAKAVVIAALSVAATELVKAGVAYLKEKVKK